MLRSKLLCRQFRRVSFNATTLDVSRIPQSILPFAQQTAILRSKPFQAENQLSISFIARPFSSTIKACERNVRDGESGEGLGQRKVKGETERGSSSTKDPISPKSTEDENELGFERSEEEALAAQLNLSARLPKDKIPQGTRASLKEVWRLIKVARREVKTMAVAFVLILIGSSINLSIPYSIGKILDLAAKPDGGIEQVFGIELSTFYVVLGGLVVVGAGAQFGRNVLLRIVGERIVARLRSQLFRRTYAQNAEFFDANKVGDLISRLGADTLIVGKAITYNLSEGIRSLISGAAGIGAMAYVNPQLTLLMAVIGPPVALGGWYYGQIIRNIGRKIQDSLGTLTKIAEERLGNVKTSQSFAGEIIEVSRYNDQVKKIFSLGVKESLYSSTYSGCINLAGNSTILIMLWFGSGMVKSGAISVGDMTSFLLYTGYAGASLTGLSNVYSELMKAVGAGSRIFDMQDLKPKISPTVGLPVKSARGPITFENVSFSYPTRPGVRIFSGLDFEIPQGSNVAIVGPSGGGKSTISSLLLRFYLPTEGSIKIDGIDITQMNVKSLRRRIGVVAQEPVLFSGTIAENIAYSKPHASRAEIIAAAHQANCQQFIATLPKGLETSVGARGTQLSGGQKQRIAIARALLKNPDILILDEATSALDAESETLVNSALAALLNGNKTTISIAHRLSTIKRSDSIIVLSADGKVAEQGPYSVLSKNPDGEFTKLMEWQLNGAATSPLSPSSESDHSSDDSEDIAVGEEVNREVEDELDEKEAQIGAGEAVRSDLGLSEGERGRH